ncbi:alanine racemase [Streptomyces coeruleorubidus]|uniref:alanine racemase n=1 Tax=Streptomyces coeruleorubidus TaxID=116188 RepID=UPI0033F06417
MADDVALRVGVESVEGAQRLGKAVRGSVRPVEVLVEVDSGSHRTGVQPHAAGEVGKAAADADWMLQVCSRSRDTATDAMRGRASVPHGTRSAR